MTSSSRRYLTALTTSLALLVAPASLAAQYFCTKRPPVRDVQRVVDSALASWPNAPSSQPMARLAYALRHGDGGYPRDWRSAVLLAERVLRRTGALPVGSLGGLIADEQIDNLLAMHLKGWWGARIDLVAADSLLRLAARRNLDVTEHRKRFERLRGLQAGFVAGLAARERGDLGTAFVLLSEAAEAGHDDAMLLVAEMLTIGGGTPSNADLATRWYERAGEHPIALMNLASQRLAAGDKPKAAEYVLRAANLDEPGAMLMLGDGFATPLFGWARNTAEARCWYERTTRFPTGYDGSSRSLIVDAARERLRMLSQGR